MTKCDDCLWNIVGVVGEGGDYCALNEPRGEDCHYFVSVSENEEEEDGGEAA